MSISPRSKGQSSLEFVTMTVLLLLIFTIFVSLFSGNQAEAVKEERARIALAVADQIAFELDLAFTEDQGFSRTFDLRDSIGGQEYNVIVNGSTVHLSYGDNRSVVSTTAADNVTGEVKPGENTVDNEGGVIYVTQP
ncbi:MAG: hypothetical protein MUP63_00140 [Candidatus Nanohaloarchaeota archaeon QJJ-7]|nr:hypothetical protein [Candidatus Nanohaloarchaeota archaeon QJJ-7]